MTALQEKSIQVTFEPVYTTLNSFALLTQTEQLPGLNPWVRQMAATMTVGQQRINRLIFEGLRDALTPPGMPRTDFARYLVWLVEQDTETLRATVLEGLRERYALRTAQEVPTSERLLEDRAAYLTCVEAVQVGKSGFDRALQSQVHQLLTDSSDLRTLLYEHLSELWQHFQQEWQRRNRTLQWQAEMFGRSLVEGLGLAETILRFTGRPLPEEVSARLAEASTVILVPALHTGRHLTLWEGATETRLFFSVPPNYDVAYLWQTPIGRGELRARFAALADETRLRILDLLVEQDELQAQEIIAALGLSQSSVSRHLKQLASLNYLYEQRGEGANKTYRLSAFYLERTKQALDQLAAGTEREQPSQVDQRPLDLRRFLDQEGRLTQWPPALQRDKLLILAYLAGFFEPRQDYSEKEVNALLQRQSTFRDHAALRRGLQDYGFMDRTRDGSRYWLREPKDRL